MVGPKGGFNITNQILSAASESQLNSEHSYLVDWSSVAITVPLSWTITLNLLHLECDYVFCFFFRANQSEINCKETKKHRTKPMNSTGAGEKRREPAAPGEPKPNYLEGRLCFSCM
jgi:hypothetical protein